MEKLEAIILKCNFFQSNCERIVAFYYSYSSLHYIHGLSTTYPGERILETGNANKKNFWAQKNHEIEFRTHEIPARRGSEPTKYPQEKLLEDEIPTR